MRQIQRTFFRHVKDNQPVAGAPVDWASLVTALKTPTRGDKESAALWSPATYPPGRTRASASVESVSLLVLDLDAIPNAEIDAAVTPFLGRRFLIHATASDTADVRSLRVVFDLTRDVTRAEWVRFYYQACFELGSPPKDPACSDASRIYYVPTRGEGQDYYFGVSEGAPIDVDAVLSRAADAAGVEESDGFAIVPEGRAPGHVLDAARERLRKHGPAIEGKNGDRHTLTAASYLVRNYALDDETALGLLAEWNRGCQPPWRLDELERKLFNARMHGKGAIGADRAPGFVERAIEESRNDRADSTAVTVIDAPVTPTGRVRKTLGEISRERKPPVVKIPTGFAVLDSHLRGGLATGQLALVMAPPGRGKSGFIVGLSVALSKTKPNLIVSTELESVEVLARYAAPIMGVPWEEITRGLHPQEKVNAAIEHLNIQVIGCEMLPRNGDEAVALIAREARAMGSPVIVIDYLQNLLRGTDQTQHRARLGDITWGLRALAQELNTVVLAVSSFGRANYKRDPKAGSDTTQYLGAGKESGDIEFDAAVIMFLDVADPEDGKDYRAAKLVLPKVRGGTPGQIGMRFYGATGAWEECAESLEAFAEDAPKRGSESDTGAVNKAKKALLESVRDLVRRGKDVSKDLVITGLTGFRKQVTRVAWAQLESDGLLIREQKQKANGLFFEKRFVYRIGDGKE